MEMTLDDTAKSKQSNHEDLDIESKTFRGTRAEWNNLTKEIRSKFLYCKFDSLNKYNIGDIVLDGNDVKLFDGQRFNVIEKELKGSSPKILPKNCTRCGAPVDSLKLRCEYCGCEY